MTIKNIGNGVYHDNSKGNYFLDGEIGRYPTKEEAREKADALTRHTSKGVWIISQKK